MRQFDTALVGGRKQAEYLRKLGFREDRIFAGYDAVDNGYFSGGVRDAKEEGSRLRERVLGFRRTISSAAHALLEGRTLMAYLRHMDDIETDVQVIHGDWWF